MSVKFPWIFLRPETQRFATKTKSRNSHGNLTEISRTLFQKSHGPFFRILTTIFEHHSGAFFPIALCLPTQLLCTSVGGEISAEILVEISTNLLDEFGLNRRPSSQLRSWPRIRQKSLPRVAKSPSDFLLCSILGLPYQGGVHQIWHVGHVWLVGLAWVAWTASCALERGLWCKGLIIIFYFAFYRAVSKSKKHFFFTWGFCGFCRSNPYIVCESALRTYYDTLWCSCEVVSCARANG